MLYARGGRYRGTARRTRGSDGCWYASAIERDRGEELAVLERAGAITALVRQETILLAGAVSYRADFVFRDERHRLVVEDTKGNYLSDRFRTILQLWPLWGPAPLRIMVRADRRSRAIVCGREILPHPTERMVFLRAAIAQAVSGEASADAE
jgi:hypothetical protein